MADEHRRVEPRGVVGSGMLTDPERIEQLEHDRDRIERSWRDAPKRKFGEVLSEAPARPSRDEEEAPADPRRRRAPGTEGEGEPDEAKADAPTGSGAAPAPIEGVERAQDERSLPRVPPDPRMARLHAMVSKGAPPSAPRGKRS